MNNVQQIIKNVHTSYFSSYKLNLEKKGRNMLDTARLKHPTALAYHPPPSPQYFEFI